MWANARFHLGLSDEGFLDLQPRQYFLLMEKHNEQTRHNELLAGIIASTVANFSPYPPKKPLSAAVFMPSEQANKPAKAKRRTRKDREATASIVRAMLTARANLDMQTLKEPNAS